MTSNATTTTPATTASSSTARRRLFIDPAQTSSWFFNTLGPVQPFTSHETLFRRRNQPLEETISLEPFIARAWAIGRRKVRDNMQLMGANLSFSRDELQLVERKMDFIVEALKQHMEEKADEWAALGTEDEETEEEAEAAKVVAAEVEDICQEAEERALKSTAEGEHFCLEVLRYGFEPVVAAMVYSMTTLSLYDLFNFATRVLSAAHARWGHRLSVIDASQFALFERLMAMREAVPLVPHTTTLYRGQPMEDHALAIGQQVTIGYFTSTSTDREVAVDFLKHQDSGRPGTNKYLLEYTGPLFGISMKHFSEFPEENEVLLFPYQTFLVVDIVQQNSAAIGDYTVVKLHSQAEKAVQMLRKVWRHFPNSGDLPPPLTAFAPSTETVQQRLDSLYSRSSSQILYTLLDDAIRENYFICSTDLRHFPSFCSEEMTGSGNDSGESIAETRFPKSLTPPFSLLPNAHIFVFRQLSTVTNTTRLFEILSEALSLVGYEALKTEIQAVHFTTLVPNIQLLERALQQAELSNKCYNQSPVYCKVQTEVHRPGETEAVWYNEPDCFFYTLSPKEVRQLYKLCIENDSNNGTGDATSFILGPKHEKEWNTERFYQLFSRDEYPQMKVAQVVDKGHWDDHFKDHFMFAFHEKIISLSIDFETVLKSASFVALLLALCMLTLLCLLLVPIYPFAGLFSIYSLVAKSLLLGGVTYTAYYFRLYILASLIDAFPTVDFFQCKKCGKRNCDKHCLGERVIKKQTILTKLFIFLFNLQAFTRNYFRVDKLCKMLILNNEIPS